MSDETDELREELGALLNVRKHADERIQEIMRELNLVIVSVGE